eukprot:CAMPEP_0172496230 /NCGR_PEP_ID=MMETSP1066-20121228/83653_1 /TAXON_ID=671091 /ORGANISM="Coscinodiscus wailesii, Strain CCMP2513" /LENGTH=479 /DNA_ID=CAMNT_0013268411 /DNA_START=39 /DNA_END=1478 /DNA_ORIENTATION=+
MGTKTKYALVEDEEKQDTKNNSEDFAENTAGAIGDIEQSSDYTDDSGSTVIPDRSILHLVGINTFAFSYGLLIATFGLLTLPTESEVLWPAQHVMLLAIFLSICGVSQLSGPVAGYFSDRCTHWSGRRRPFMFWGGVIAIPSLVVLRWASINHNLNVYMVFFTIAMLALNVMYVAYSGALTDLVNNHQRGIANGLMGAFTVIGASAGFTCFSIFLNVQSGYYFYAAVVAFGVGSALVAFTETPIDPSSHGPWTWREIGECYYVSPKDHKEFYLVFVSRTLYYMGISVQAFMLFFFRDVIHYSDPQRGVSYLALCGQLTGATVCVPMGMLSSRIGRKPLIYLSSGIIVYAYTMFMFARSLPIALMTGAIYGIGNGTYLSVDYALACDTLPCKKSAARYLGIWGVGAFIGTLIGPLLLGPTLLLFGENGNVDDRGAPSYDTIGYIAMLIVGCIFMVIGALVIIPIKSSTHQNPQEDSDSHN